MELTGHQVTPPGPASLQVPALPPHLAEETPAVRAGPGDLWSRVKAAERGQQGE
ncbi:MAG: hypothetical protein ACRDUV_08250 [Pseudonocardiaceae bacterium]